MKILENFNTLSLSKSFFWFNEPTRYKLGNGLEIYTDEKTDFWQRTHYGFQRDDGHCLFTRHNGDFIMSTHVEFRPQHQYDQCGLMVRINSENWIKVSTEFEDEKKSRLGSVVTNLGYSDWATQDISSEHSHMWYKINKNGSDFFLEHSYNGNTWQQLRLAHLHQKFETLDIGLYTCSPTHKNFYCKFHWFEIKN